jgi:peptide/nickel transport system permease protein
MTDPGGVASAPPGGSGPPPEADAVGAAEGLDVEVRTLWKLALRRFVRHRLAMASLAVLVVIGLAAAFPDPLIDAAPGHPLERNLNLRQHPPSAEAWLGTDQLGRDYFSRNLLAARTSLGAALVVAVVSTAIGSVVGLLSGYLRGWVDNVLMRVVDLILAIPFLAALLVILAFTRTRDPLTIGLIISLFVWVVLARVVRGNVLSLREKNFVEAARASGAGDLRIMFRHILPNTVSPIIVQATLVIALTILLESALSFLGFGIERPFPALGKMIDEGQRFMLTDWWLVWVPGLTIVLVCLCVNFVGDGLRDALDPTQRHR